MKLKALSQAVIAASLVSGATLAQAEEEKGFEIAGNVALATDYRFRGFTQTDGGPAIQGGFDIEHDSGLYVGVWGSNIDFGQGSIELDYYVGYGFDITKDVSADIGWVYYDYPQGEEGGQELNYVEYYGSVSAAGFTLGAAYSPDYTGDPGPGIEDDYYYTYLDYSMGLPEDISLDLHYGHNKFGSNAAQGGFTGDGSDDDYADWSVGLSKDVFGVTWGVAYTDTDVSSSDCGSGNCDGTVVFSISKSL